MRFSRVLWLAASTAALLFVISCGDDETAPLGINNVSPIGSVGGLVLDAATMKPLSGVQVNVIAGGTAYPASAKTDSSGRFSVLNVPAGDVIIRMIPDNTANYNDVTIQTTFVNAAGEWPLNNATLSVGPIGMVPLASQANALRLMMVTGDGAPASSVKATLVSTVGYVDFSTGKPVAKGHLAVDATSSSTGLTRFTGMPDFTKLAALSGTVTDTVKVVVPPYDSDSDGVYDFLGKETIYSANQLKDHIPTLVLTSSAPKTLKIEAASVAALMGQTGVRELTSASGPLYVAFNWPISSTLTRVSLYDEFGVRPANLPTTSISANLLTVSFKGLKAGAEYNITINAYATVGDSLISGTFGAPFFTPPTSTTVTATLNRASTDSTSSDYNKVIITFSEPIGTGTASKSLTGNDCVLYFGYDLDGSGKTGDASGERGYSSSNKPLYILETAPPGVAGLSGISSRWYFQIPTTSLGNPLAAGTPLDLNFTRINTNVERASGALMTDMTSLVIPN